MPVDETAEVFDIVRPEKTDLVLKPRILPLHKAHLHHSLQKVARIDRYVVN